MTLNMIENGATRLRATTLRALQAVLQAGGVEFLGEDGAGVGARFRGGRAA